MSNVTAKGDEIAVLHHLWTDPEIRRFLFDHHVLTLDESRSFVTASVENLRDRGLGLWLVHLREAPDLAGFAGLLARDDEPPYLIYGIRPDLCGRGLATEAATSVLRHLLHELKLASVVADVDEPNVASIRVLEKLGMARVRRAVVNDKPLLYFEARAADGPNP